MTKPLALDSSGAQPSKRLIGNEPGRIAARQSSEIRLAFRMYIQHGIGT